MAPFTNALSETDVRNLASYFAAQSAGPVVVGKVPNDDGGRRTHLHQR